MAEPLECGGKIVDVWFETMPDGKVNGFISCVDCDLTKVFEDIKVSVSPSSVDEGDDIKTDVVAKEGKGSDPSVLADLQEWARQVSLVDMEMDVIISPPLPPIPKAQSLPKRPRPVIKDRGRRTFHYRRRER